MIDNSEKSMLTTVSTFGANYDDQDSRDWAIDSVAHNNTKDKQSKNDKFNSLNWEENLKMLDKDKDRKEAENEWNDDDDEMVSFVLGDIKDINVGEIKANFSKHLNSIFKSMNIELNTCKTNDIESFIKISEVPSFLFNSKTKELIVNTKTKEMWWKCNKELVKSHKRFKISQWECKINKSEKDSIEIVEEIKNSKEEKYAIIRIENKIVLEYQPNELRNRIEIKSLGNL